LYTQAITDSLGIREKPFLRTYSVKHIGKTETGGFGVTSRKTLMKEKTKIDKSVSAIRMNLEKDMNSK
jgi:hypothetical protein